ncbi:hypothetical protein KVV02_008585 [Mortierella alpina]|uniref:Uncharacterized protein n=1 Tax=Mortierella alpina TaxID=64518 RepID=A0A9P8CZE2_MORAP|nr:hypothetical protein KVV02_008585 [Mortierella alpina]
MFSRSSSSSFVALVYVVVLATMALLATTPMAAQAGCTLECAGINAKIVFCGYVRNGFQDTMPPIGVDASLDNCLCNNDNVELYRNCMACKDLGTAMNVTQKFISDCKITNQSRNLKNGALSRLGSLPSSAVYAVVMVASVGMGAALGL